MKIYLVNILLILVFGFIFLWYKPSIKSKKIFCAIVTIQWIILSGLRHISVGADTCAYKLYYFDNIISSSWGEIFEKFINIIFKGESGKDPGYILFVKFIQIFTTNYQVYLIIIALIFTIPLGIWIYKNSNEPCISFLIYTCLFSAFFAITGIRQTIATALICLIGYRFIKERKILKFIIITILAVIIHKSAICFFPFYFIANKKITRKYIFMMSIIIFSMFILKNKVMAILGGIMGYEEYVKQYEGAGTWNFTIILIILTLVTIWRSEVILKNNLLSKHYINALLIAFIFVPLTFIDPSTMRVVQYYSIFIMLLIPEIINSFSKKERISIYYISVFLLIALYIKTNPQYLFFWQGW